MSARPARLRILAVSSALLAAAAVLAPAAQARSTFVDATLQQHANSVSISWINSDAPTAVYVDIFQATNCSGLSTFIEQGTGLTGSTTITAGSLVEFIGPAFPLAPGTYGFQVTSSISGTFRSDCMVGTVAYPAPDATPPSWLHSYGRAAASDTCLAGWSPSWAEWMNGGKGGYVCNREQYYDTSTGEWAFR